LLAEEAGRMGHAFGVTYQPSMKTKLSLKDWNETF
jgi:hypothetical protein